MFKAWPLAIVLPLSACGDVAAASPDPSSDLDCAIMVSMAAEAIQQQSNWDKQKLAYEIVYQWYYSKIRESGEVQDSRMSSQYVTDIHTKLNANMEEANRKFRACAARAEGDPEFEEFAKTLGWPS